MNDFLEGFFAVVDKEFIGFMFGILFFVICGFIMASGLAFALIRFGLV